VACRHQSAQNLPVSWRKQRLRVSLLVLVRREIVHVFRALVSQARLMLSLARRGEAVGRPADRATRESEGPASSEEPDKHRGRRHRLSALLLASWAGLRSFPRVGRLRCLSCTLFEVGGSPWRRNYAHYSRWVGLPVRRVLYSSWRWVGAPYKLTF
jgi:hypothetical protein